MIHVLYTLYANAIVDVYTLYANGIVDAGARFCRIWLILKDFLRTLRTVVLEQNSTAVVECCDESGWLKRFW